MLRNIAEGFERPLPALWNSAVLLPALVDHTLIWVVVSQVQGLQSRPRVAPISESPQPCADVILTHRQQ